MVGKKEWKRKSDGVVGVEKGRRWGKLRMMVAMVRVGGQGRRDEGAKTDGCGNGERGGGNGGN